jgi:hypothetical protein
LQLVPCDSHLVKKLFLLKRRIFKTFVVLVLKIENRKLSSRGEIKKEVNMFWGVLVGIIAMSFLGFIPLFGPPLAGFIAGLIVRGAGKGALAGFLSGSFGGILALLILPGLGGLVGTFSGGLFGGVLGGTVGTILGGGIFISTLYFGLLGLVGGALGGLVRPR